MLRFSREYLTRPSLLAVAFTALATALVFFPAEPSRGARAPEMSAIDRLVAIEDIKQLKARYFRCVASKDWECWRGVFAPDFVDSGQTLGPDGMMQRMHDNGLYDRVKTVFEGHLPEIEVLSSTAARGIWPADFILYYPTGQSYPTTGKEAVALGKATHTYTFYVETYEKIGGKWFIKTMDNSSKRLRTDDDGGITIPTPPPAK